MSFTHLIGYALVKALQGDAGDERRLRRRRRQAQPDHARRTSTSAWRSTCRSPTAPASCWCPSIKAAETMDFAAFWTAYEEIVRKARDNKLDGRRLPGHHDHA